MGGTLAAGDDTLEQQGCIGAHSTLAAGATTQPAACAGVINSQHIPTSKHKPAVETVQQKHASLACAGSCKSARRPQQLQKRKACIGAAAAQGVARGARQASAGVAAAQGVRGSCSSAWRTRKPKRGTARGSLWRSRRALNHHLGEHYTTGAGNGTKMLGGAMAPGPQLQARTHTRV